MSEVWSTKAGLHRVRRDPPTVEEAVLAAQGLTDQVSQQIEIVASLMEVPLDQARSAVLRAGDRKQVTRAIISDRSARAVVVERRTPRHLVGARRTSVR